MKRKKLSNKTKGKLIIVAVIVSVIALVAGFIFSRLISIIGGFDNYVDSLEKWFSLYKDSDSYRMLLVVIAILILLALTILLMTIVLPVFGFFFGRLFAYFKICQLCRKNGHSCRFHRAPFASLLGVKRGSHIEIGIYQKTLHVHFVGIPFPWFRTFVLVNDREYRMHKSVWNRKKGILEGRLPREREIVEDMFNTYSIPEFPLKGTEYHYLVVDPFYAAAKYRKDGVVLNAIDECAIDNITVCRLKTLRQRLNNELFAPMR